MSQYTFRLNTKPTYSERMTEARSELRKIIKEQLCKSSPAFPPSSFSLPRGITNDRNAAMGWSRKAYMKNVVQRYRVRIEGWPLGEVPFRNLSDVSNLPKLELLLRGWKEGSIRFVPISEAQYAAMVADPSPWIGAPEGAAEREGPDAESED
ncbi:hypothetical protein L226DRAFT_543813 [Lentinus tigrinus ALCF2SS1-7]|uniref:uncharacterized protein n=1 Tax=Lentinus tigrinus ALCF2SS1-7 TaxID=1328758 RepID=UPI001165F84A|nr:hypothetical protein L226DRAFT_543813 [Lentinus tigrinus ALCF2SS1-7]